MKFTVPKRPLGRADVEFNIKRGRQALGRLKVSNGTVVCCPRPGAVRSTRHPDLVHHARSTHR